MVSPTASCRRASATATNEATAGPCTVASCKASSKVKSFPVQARSRMSRSSGEDASQAARRCSADDALACGVANEVIASEFAKEFMAGSHILLEDVWQ